MSNDTFQRNTKQRSLILKELCSVTTHPTAQELLDMVRSEMPKISLSTVYRNLEVMARQGLILKLDSNSGQSRFDGNTVPHCHLECTKCGSVYDAPAPAQELLDRHVEELDGFEIDSWRLEYTGTCHNCLRKH
ncbi:MAG: transcriptional repressor [bacterium]|nr:transcriptional repressor [bacterium]